MFLDVFVFGSIIMKFPQQYALYPLSRRCKIQTMSTGSTPRLLEFRREVVGLILGGDPELALHLLSKHYDVREPTLRVGTVKGHRKVLACYVEREKRIYLSNSRFMTDPFVVLHEFYHHLRASRVGKSRQVETRADLFAANYIRGFMSWKGSRAGGHS
jgi:hypothetical protein